MRKPTPQQASDFYRILRDYLGGIAGGVAVIEQFERDPDASAPDLADFLRRHAPEDKELAARLSQALSTNAQSQFVTEVTGGHVDQIVNIAKVGALQLTIKRQFFLLRDVRQVLVVLLFVLFQRLPLKERAVPLLRID